MGQVYAYTKGGTIQDCQDFFRAVYEIPNNRSHSLESLLIQQQRFAMRALKGIRKNDIEKTKYNLLITLSWTMSICNRLSISLEDEIWKRFPYKCSYCGSAPCQCKKIKSEQRMDVYPEKEQPTSISGYQKMFEVIYPSTSRTLEHAGIHFGEEIGEVGEAVHGYLGMHSAAIFAEIGPEIADLASCLFGIANSASIDVEGELVQLYSNNCHVCHHAPCTCTFDEVVSLKT